MSDWKVEELTEFPASTSKYWKVSRLTTPDGKTLKSVKLFGKKKDGTEYQTKHGFTFQEADCTKENFSGLAKALKFLIKE